MGTFLDSLSIRTGDAAGVKARLVPWLKAKGYEVLAEPPLFPLTTGLAALGGEDDEERGVFLVWNRDWTVLLYSHMLAEGERLLFELGRDPAPVVRTWVHDSDLWGYTLYRDGSPLAEFNSNPHYFGAADEPSPNGDPELLAEVCGLGDGGTGVAALQGRRALFAEDTCLRFCAALGASPAGFDYRALAEAGLDVPGAVTLGDFHLEHLYFVRHGQQPEPLPDLHRLVIHPAAESTDTPSPQFTPDELARMHNFQRMARGCAYLFLPLGLLIGLAFRLWFWLRTSAWFNRLAGSAPPQDSFALHLYTTPRRPVRQEGRDLIHERHRFRITLPEGVEPGSAGGMAGWVFQLSLRGRPAIVEALRPRHLEIRLRLHPGMRVVEDETFFVGPLPARRIVREGPTPAMSQALFVVQGPRAYYYFWLAGTAPSAEELALLRTVVDSFRLLDDQGN